MKFLSLTVQKLKRRLKLTTSRQTNRQTDKQAGQKQYAPDHSIGGHKKLLYSVCIGSRGNAYGNMRVLIEFMVN